MKTTFRNHIHLIMTIVVMTTTGCKNYVQYKYGISSPREESPGSLLTFLETRNFPTTNIYIFSDSSGYGQLIRNNTFRQNLLSHMIFDRKGNLLERDTSACQWAGYDFILRLRPDSVYPFGNSLLRTELLDRITPLGLSEKDHPGQEAPDFTVVVTWGKFLGKYNYRLFDLESACTGNKRARIQLIWLNIDMQKSWHLEPDQRLQFN